MVEKELQQRKQDLDERPQELKASAPEIVIDRALQTLSYSFIEREVSIAREKHLHYIILMGIHACILTINRYILGTPRDKTSQKAAFKAYLQKYVDGTRDDLLFSRYSDSIYDRRNDLAHQFFSKTTHSFGFDSNMEAGIVESEGIVLINTVIYFDQFKSAFERNRKTKKSIWDIAANMNNEELIAAKNRILKAYE